MACSSVSTAASGEEEKKELRLFDVMFLCDEWKSSKGGLTTFNREFAINLAEMTTGSMKIHCYVLQSDDRDKEDANQHGVNLITAKTVPGSRDPLDWLKVPPPEIQHPHVIIGHGRKFGTPACLIQRATRCKWIQFVHVFCEDLGKFKETTATAVTDTIEENEEKHKREIELCKAADAVVAVGSRLQQKYSRSLPKVEVKIITPGIMEKFCNESIESGDHAGLLSWTLNVFTSYMFMKKFKVFMFGRATHEDLALKGYDIVANAIGSLGEKFELTFVGSSPGDHRNLERWFLQNTRIKRKQITIRGYCTEQDEVKEMFHQSDLVALPSRTEGFGLVALEAISSGVPVLVSGESGVAEALQEVEGGNSVIVESDDDAAEWARRISEVSSQSLEEREARARQLRDNYRKVYCWRRECERFKGLVENVVKTSNDAEVNITTEVEDLKTAESINQTTTSTFQKVEYQRASAAPTTMEGESHTRKEDIQALKEEALCLIAINYLKTTPPQTDDEHNKFKEYLKEMQLIMKGSYPGSLVITVKCDSLQILEELWKDYSSGHLGEVVQNCFATEKILKELNLAELRLKTTMDIEEYNACKLYFEKVALRDALSAQSYFISTEDEAQLERWKQKSEVVESEKVKSALSSEFRSISSTRESPQKQEELKKWKQKTKIEETEKVKGTWPVPGLLASDPEEESEKLRLKLQEMKGTLLSTKLSTAGHGKELEGKLKTMKLQEEKSILQLPLSEEELLMKRQSMKGTSPSTILSIAGHREELRHRAMKLQEEKGSLPPPPLFTTDLEEKLEEVCAKLKRRRMKGSLPVPKSSAGYLEKKLEELHMELKKLRMKDTLPPPGLFTADLEDNLERELEELRAKISKERREGSLSLSDNTFKVELIQLLEKLKKERIEVSIYPTIQSGLAEFDVSSPEELRSYVRYLLNESAKLGLRRRVLRSPNAVKELLEAMDEYELKTFLTIHIREGAWQVVLLFTDELPSNKLPRNWFDEMWDRPKGEETISSSLYCSTSGILKAWPTECDPELVTLCEAITDRDWKVTRLILSGSPISDEGLKNLSTALTQGELYSLILCANDLQSQGFKHLCEALISGDCNLTSLSVTRNGLGDEGITHLCNVLTSINCKLTSLNVSQNFFGDEGIKHLCDALISANCTLTSLKVSWNVLGDEGIMPLARTLTNNNCALTSLDISFNRIGDEGIKYLCKALTDTNCKLRSLDLDGNLKVTDVGKQSLSEVITGTDWEVREGLTLSRSVNSKV